MTKTAAVWQRIRSVLIAVVALLTSPAIAFAQEFEKVKDIPTQNVPAGRFVVIAYSIIWLAILVYVLLVASGIRRVNDQIADLKRKLDRRTP
jgi:CcmD family protein